MVRIVRAEDLTQIYATTTSGKDVLIAAQLDGRKPAQRRLRLYNIGDGRAYTSNFSIGCGGERSYKLADSPAALTAAFKKAGLPAPRVACSAWRWPVFKWPTGPVTHPITGCKAPHNPV